MNTTFAIRLPEEQLEILRMIAKHEDRSVSAVIRRMIENDLAEREQLGIDHDLPKQKE